MKTLGAVLAGGRSSRFGSDKAEALLHGIPLLTHAIEALRPLCDGVIVVGRQSKLVPWVEDWPGADMGPLGGIAGALNHALENGFDQVMTIPVDCAFLPPGLRAQLEPAPAYVASQPVIGLWPARAAGAIEEILFSSQASHSVRHFADRVGARAIGDIALPANINTPGDLEHLEQHHGL